MPGGRPTTYEGEKTIELVYEYLNNRKDRWDEKKQKYIVDLPTIEGLAVFVGCHKDTLYEWERKHEKFSVALNQVRQEQQDRLINKGLSGDYNSTIAKLILSSNHGFKEKTERDHTSGGNPIPIYGGNSTIQRHTGDKEDIRPEKED